MTLVAGPAKTTLTHVPTRVLPGDEVALRGVCTPAPGFFTPGSATPWQRGQRGGYGQVLQQPQLIAVNQQQRWHWRRPLAHLSDHIYDLIVRHGAHADATGLVLGLVLGNTADVLDEDMERWRDLGVVHALSVSGLHLGIVAMLVFWLSTRAAIAMARSQAAGVLGAHVFTALVVTFYAGLTGLQTATLRALVMILLILLASSQGRSLAPWRLLIISLAAMLAWQPAWICDPSFQLSAVATAALVAAAPWFVHDGVVPATRSRARRGLRWTLKAVVVSAWVSLVTAPIVAYHFHQVPIASFIANLLVTTPCELVALPMALLAVVVAPISDGLAGALLAVAEGAAVVSLVAARWLAPWLPTVECAPPALPAMAAYGAACACLWLAVRNPARRLRHGLAAAAMIAIAAMWTPVASWCARSAPAAGKLVVTFIDVGQGDAALIEFPGGARWLVDAGRSATTTKSDAAYDPLLRYLRARRITALDRVIITHRHADHFAALCHLAGRIAIRSLWRTERAAALPPPGTDGYADPMGIFDSRSATEAEFDRCETSLRTAGTVVDSPRLGIYHGPRLGGARVHVIGPRALSATSRRATAEAVRGENDNSIVVLVSYGGRTLALLGDASEEQEASLLARLIAVDAVKIGHHGSATSSAQAVVDRLRPRVAIASVGRGNRFGLPAREVMVRWEHRGATILRTDRHGSISVVIAPDGRWQWFTYVGGVVALP
ncbi:MAG: DNA internalization-related competence protein ComEC/Rec2 [Myxococcales bacterium]|nr:DNA internalization-related competence protein ComEC/Rec2 [Myxococcales bacterium]